MAITLRSLNLATLPIKGTVFGLLAEEKGRKERVKKYIDDIATRWPSTKKRIDQFWKDNAEAWGKLQDNHSLTNWRAFFGTNFNHEQDLIILARAEAREEVKKLLKLDALDSQIVKDLKATAEQDEHTQSIKTFFENAGGMTWLVFLVDTIKDFYLNYLPNYINERLGELPKLTLNDLDKSDWDNARNGFYFEIYTSFTKTEQEKDLDNLKNNLGSETSKLNSLITITRQNKQLDLYKSKIIQMGQWIRELSSKPAKVIIKYKDRPVSDSTGGESEKEKEPEEEESKPAEPVKPKEPSKEEQEWLNFFQSKGINEDLRDDWQKSGLTPAEALTALSKGWDDPQAISNKKVSSYSSNNQQTLNIDPLKSSKEEIDRDHEKKETARKEKAKNEAEWNNFYSQHGITSQSDKNAWTQGTADEAEQLYTDAIDKGVKGDPRKTALTDEEKKLINSATTPDQILINQERIKNDRKNAKWDKWFKSHSELKDLQNWKDSGLDIEESEKAYSHGWLNNEADEIIKNRSIDNYAVGNLKVSIDPLEHLKGEVEKVKGLVKQIGEAKQIKDLPANINTYQADKVPTALNTEYLTNSRKDKETEILKRLELKKYNDLLALINDAGKTTFKSLPENYEAETIANLKNELLPADKQKEKLTARIKERRAGFVLSLNKTDDDAFEDEKLKTIIASKSEENQWKAEFKGVLTFDILCKLFAQDLTDMGITKTKDKQKNRDLEQYFLGKEDAEGNATNEKRGYRIQSEPALDIKIEGKTETWKGDALWDQEEKWINNKERDKQGKLLLPFAYKKNDFDPDNLTADSFCKWTTNDKGNKIIDPVAGTLAIGTGWGKTTKTVSCLCKGGHRNIILITPTEALAQSAYGHHSPDKMGWLQFSKVEIDGVEREEPYKCVYHGEAHGKYPVSINERLTYWNNDNTKETKGAKGVNVMNQHYFLGYMARQLLDPKKIKCNSEAEKARVAKGNKWAKEQLIPTDSLLMFDEAHFNSPDYQQLFREVVFSENPKWQVLLMSATFKGKVFSITTSYPIESREVVFDLENKKVNVEEINESLAKSQNLIFMKNTDLTAEQMEALKNIPWVRFDETNADASEGISYGVPEGGAMIVDSTYRMGFSFKCQNVIDSGWEETRGINPAGWTLKTETDFYSDANMTQGRGRGGRLEPAKYYTNTANTSSPASKPNVISNMIKAIFGNVKPLQKNFFTSEKDADALANMIRAGFAYPEHFGKSPEVIFIGLDKGIPNYPKWREESKLPVSADKKIKGLYLDNYSPPKITPQQAEQTLFLMLQTKLKQQPDISQKLLIDLQSPLIKQADLKLDKNDAKGISKARVKSVLNGAVDNLLKKLPDYQENKIEYKNEATFKKIVGFYNMLDKVNITIHETEEKGKIKPDEDWWITITYN